MERAYGEDVRGGDDGRRALRKCHDRLECARSAGERVPCVTNETVRRFEALFRHPLQECHSPLAYVADEATFDEDAAHERDLAVTEFEEMIHQAIHAEAVVNANDRNAGHCGRTLPQADYRGVRVS